MAATNVIEFMSINMVLPTEMLKKILEKLDWKSLTSSKQTCQYWREIINQFKLERHASSKFIKHCFLRPIDFNLFSERISTIILAGGLNVNSSVKLHNVVEVVNEESIQLPPLPPLPSRSYGSAMVLHNGKISYCGGGLNHLKRFLQLDNGTWKDHSTLNMERSGHSVVATKAATFIFGGCLSNYTYEYLPKDSDTWLMGKTKIPLGGFAYGCAVAVKSEQEIWLIGGARDDDKRKRIRSFNVKDHTFQILPFQLKAGRSGHKCSFIPNTNKLMITGGGVGHRDCFPTEIIDTEDGSVTMASPMNFKRLSHGMGIVTINGRDRVAAFGGCDLTQRNYDTIEFYNTQTEKWEITDLKLDAEKSGFGFLDVKLNDIIPIMQDYYVIRQMNSQQITNLLDEEEDYVLNDLFCNDMITACE